METLMLVHYKPPSIIFIHETMQLDLPENVIHDLLSHLRC